MSFSKMTSEWKEASVKAHRSREKLFHKPQKEVSEEIISLFRSKVLVTLCAPPQWGKTGVSLYTSFKMCRDMNIDADSVYFITAMSDRSWVEQTRERILPMWRKNVFHRNTLNRFQKTLTKKIKKNILIIIDECHMANSINHTLGKVFDSLEVKDPESMIKNNIKILQISATPSNSLIDGDQWGDFHSKITPKVDSGYVSFERMVEEGRIHIPFCLENIDETEEYIEEITRENQPKYHLIRSVACGAVGSETYVNIQQNFDILCEEKGFEFIEMNMTMERSEIRKLFENLKKEPQKHTFILIKNMLGASKTLDDTFIGSVHESFPMKKDFNAEIQGLPGRLCGWTKRRGKDATKIYCDRFIIEKYIELYRSNFSYSGEDFIWRDSRLKVNQSGNLSSKTSFITLN